MIWTDSPSWITCWNDTNSYVRALQDPKIEFILAQHPWMENDCHARRPGAAVLDGDGDRRHRRGVDERPVQLPLLSSPRPSSPGASRRATTRSSAPSPNGSASWRSTRRARPSRSGSRSAGRTPAPLGRSPTKSSRRRGTTSSRRTRTGRRTKPGCSISTRTRRRTPLPPPAARSSSIPPAWPSTSRMTMRDRRCRSGYRKVSLTRRAGMASGARSSLCS